MQIFRHLSATHIVLRKKFLSQNVLEKTINIYLRSMQIWVFSFYIFYIALEFHVIEVPISHMVRHTTFRRTPLSEGSARRRDFYMKTYSTHKTVGHTLGGIRTRNPRNRGDANLDSLVLDSGAPGSASWPIEVKFT